MQEFNDKIIAELPELGSELPGVAAYSELDPLQAARADRVASSYISRVIQRDGTVRQVGGILIVALQEGPFTTVPYSINIPSQGEGE